MRLFVACLIVVVCVTETQAGWLFHRRATCTGGSCHSVQTAVQKGAVQKDTPAQKTDEAVQKDSATQKDATQKSGEVKAVVVTQGSLLYGICLRKARLQAARGRVFHPGGSMGGCHYEGCGSGSTATAALNACCYTGQRRCAASAVVRGANGRFYATKLFW
jgi:hypothetical protein